MNKTDLCIIGGGPAGLSAAAAARKAGIEDILIIERDTKRGGILNQCIHNGFGLHTFNEELTGPEYAQKYIDIDDNLNIPYKTGTIVTDISETKVVTYMNEEEGLSQIKAGAVILAMGCRERPRGALNIPGYRPAGIYTAGTAQRLINIEGHLVGKKVVILGSGDIGLIMSRRMTLEGAKVQVVAELMSFSGGLKRNIVQCLDDYGIPLKLSHTVVGIEGKEHLTGVTIAAVDENKKPIPGTFTHYEADTLLLSCGLIPENELSKEAGISMDPVTGGSIVNDNFETSVSGIFACGNVLHVHDLVDFVSKEAALAGESAAEFIMENKDLLAKEKSNEQKLVNIKAENGVRYTVPQKINITNMKDKLTVRFRVADVYTDRSICVYYDDEKISSIKKKVLAPGEMEQVIIDKKSFENHQNVNMIRICTE